MATVKEQLRSYDGKSMTLREALATDVSKTPYFIVYIVKGNVGTKVQKDDYEKYLSYHGMFQYFEDDDGYGSQHQRILIPYLFFNIEGDQ